jgi:hypothetical protein
VGLELLGRKFIGSGLENRDYGRWGSVALTMQHRSILKNVGNNFADKRRELGIVRSRTEATEFFFFVRSRMQYCDVVSVGGVRRKFVKNVLAQANFRVRVPR